MCGRWFGQRDIAVKQNAVLTSRCGKMGFAKDVYQKKIEAVGYVAVVDRFNIELFSALEQTYSARM